MATEAGNAKGKNTSDKMRTITSLSFRMGGPDDELIGAANEFARLPENQGIPPTSLLRNYITRKLKEAIKQARLSTQNTIRNTG